MHNIIIQKEAHLSGIPKQTQINQWVQKFFEFKPSDPVEVTIRIVSKNEITALNKRYRAKPHTTNVLAFPLNTQDVHFRVLGDIVICAAVVKQEAKEQQKSVTAHFAHMCIHGLLHLMGYDHKTEKEAFEMETLEIAFLNTLGFKNPYWRK